MRDDELEPLLDQAARRYDAPAGCCPPPERLAALYAGDLDERESSALGEHLALCAACRVEATAARRFAAAMSAAAAPHAGRPRTLWVWTAAAALVASSVGLYLHGGPSPRFAVSIPRAPYAPAAVDAARLLLRDAEGVDPELEASFARAIAPYRAGDDRAAAGALAAHLARHPLDQRARFYRAVALLSAGGRDAEAREQLSEVERLASPALAAEARYYAALAALRTGDEGGARARLALLAAEPGPHRAHAAELLRALDQDAP